MNIKEKRSDNHAGTPEVALPWTVFSAARNRMASNAQTSQKLLHWLALRANTPVQQRVAENTNSTKETLDLLSLHSSANVRAAVARNTSTLSKTVDRLSKDENPDVRYALAEDPGTSATILAELSNDENPFVQDRALRTQTRVADELQSVRSRTPRADSVSIAIQFQPRKAARTVDVS